MSYLIGIDVGGTNVRMALYSIEERRVIDFSSSALKKYDAIDVEIEQNICSIVKEKMSKLSIEIEQLMGIGISIAANFERKSGRITKWPNNPRWNGFSLKKYLSGYFGVQVVLEDDANSAALGEFICQKQTKNSLLYCTVGTGIGLGIILNGKIYLGDFEMAGELGHLKVINNNNRCICGEVGCLQTFVRSRENDKSLCANIDDEGISMKELAPNLAYCLYQIAYLLDISLTIVGGGMIEYNTDLYKEIEIHFQGYMGRNSLSHVIRKSNLYNKNGVYGALKLINDVI